MNRSGDLTSTGFFSPQKIKIHGVVPRRQEPGLSWASIVFLATASPEALQAQHTHGQGDKILRSFSIPGSDEIIPFSESTL